MLGHSPIADTPIAAVPVASGSANYAITALAGSYAVTGKAATVARSKAISALAGSYTVTGKDATLTYTPHSGAYVVTAESGSYLVSGQDATLARTGGQPSFAAEIELKPRKWYVKRKKQILVFNTAQEADAYIEAEEAAEQAIQQAQKTSRRARKRLREKVITVRPIDTVDIDQLSQAVEHFQIGVDLPYLLAQQDFDRVMQILAMARDMQDEEDVELLLLA
jgi:hypothetical protein